MDNSPRFVAIAATDITPSRPRIWVRDGREIRAGEKVLVIYTPGDPKYSSQCRIYPLTPDHQRHNKPAPIMSVTLSAAVPPKSHVIIDQEGVAVFITPASRRRAVRWQLDRAEQTGRSGDMIDALIDFDRLILHAAVAGDIDTVAVNGDYEKVQKLKALAASTTFAQERDAALRKALELSKKICNFA